VRKIRSNPGPRNSDRELLKRGGCYYTDDSSRITLPLPDSAIFRRKPTGFRVVLVCRSPVATGVSLS